MMKKLISLALTLAMLCCMATTAFAANVVGRHNTTGSYNDGDVLNDAFGGEMPSAEIKINVATGETISRYAVDIEFSEFTLDIGSGNQTWDVNKLEYVYTDNTTNDATEFESGNITVTNYSDNEVYISTVFDKEKDDDGLVLTTSLTEEYTEVPSAAPEAGHTKGEAKTKTFTLKAALAEGTTWTDVANAYANELALADDGVVTIATCKIIITPDNA